MPEFQKKNSKFTHKGINWNAPVDLIPDGQIPFARNVRVNQAGTVSQRPGVTLYANLGNGYTHTITRLNNSDSNVNFSRALVVSKDATLYVGAAQFDLGPPATAENAANTAIKASLVSTLLNPVPLPEGITLSGNPLSIVDMAPVSSNAGWKYCGDSNGNFAIGYYPGDNPTANKARVNRLGLKPPVLGNGSAGMLIYNTGTDNLDGKYQWMFAYRNRWTGARSNPSAPTRDSQAEPKVVLLKGYVTMVLPNSGDAAILVDVYRVGGNIDDWKYVGTGNGGDLFTDNTADSEILTAPTPPGLTDVLTKSFRFNIYQPFVTQDYARFGYGTLSVSLGGVWALTWAAATPPEFSHHFDPGWLQGSFISINNGSFSIYEASSANQLIITEDLSGMTVGGVPVTNGTLVKWSTHAGTLTMGAPLAHIWGPYGLGQTGAYIFGCGDPNNAGTLYWTNGNDPDSTDLINSVIVTSPSEPLRGGCVYDGTPFVFSTERMFRIYPGNVAGQFTVQEVSGSKGLWAEWSLTVQSNGFADQSISWVGKDGIYDWSASGGLHTMTDRDLYPFFPHDNQPGVSVATLLPWLAEATPVQAPNFALDKMKFHRLSWNQGELFYDFPAGSLDYNTLVYDSREANGWVSVDQYPSGGGGLSQESVGRGTEVAGNNMFVAIGGKLSTCTGTTDLGATIPCRFTTRSDDLGDPRVMKLYGDYMLDADTGGVLVTCKTWLDNYHTSGASTTLGTSGRTQGVLDFSTGLGILGASHAFDFTWGATSPVILYQWAYSFVPKPEQTFLRATDKTDDGYSGAKYLRGLCIEANTFNQVRVVKILVDGVTAGTVNITCNGQQEIPFAITAVVGSEFQLQPTDANPWEIFTVRWVWEKWPDLTPLESNWLDLGTAKPKYIRSFTIPISAPSTAPLSFAATYDGTQTYSTTTVTPFTATTKSPAQFSFNPPILAHQIKLVPSIPCRCWYDQIVWDAEEWPELATMYGPVEKLGDSGAKYLRGLELPIETNGQNVVMSLRFDVSSGVGAGGWGLENFAAVSTDPLSKHVFALTPLSPVIAHEFQLFSNAPARFWYSEVKWDYEQWPEYDIGYSPWLDGGTIGAKFVRGISIPVDTGGQPVTFDLFPDTGNSVTFGPFNTQAANKTVIYCGFAVPLIFHEFQLRPRTNCRVWYEEIKWDMDPWPEAEVESSGWIDGGTISAKYTRGITIPIETGGNAVMFDLYTDTGATIAFGPFSSPPSVKTAVYCGFNVPLVLHEFRIQPRTTCRCWYSEIKWDMDPWPELEIESSGWLDGGSISAKFIRGITLPIDTAGASVLFDIFTDTGQTVTFGPFATALSVKTSVYCGLAVPLIIHQFRIQPRSSCRCWYGELKWDAESWPELEIESSPWLDGGNNGAKFTRGITIPIDTGGLAVTLSIYTDIGQTIQFGPFTTAAGVKASVYCGLTVPLLIHQFRIQSNSSCRIWHSEIKWDAENWPEYEVESSPWLDGGNPGAKFVKGITMPIDTNATSVMFDLYTDTGVVVPFGPFTTLQTVKTSVYCGFAVPLVFHQFRIQPRTNCRCWYGEIKWDSDSWPELEIEASSYTDAGYQGAKFLQGLVFPIDTNGQSVQITMLCEGGTIDSNIGPFATQAGSKTVVAWSFHVPIIAHNMILIPQSNCRIWYDEVKWIWEPLPELVTTYTTQETNLDLPGYHYQFDAYIAYIGVSAEVPILHITTEYGTVDYPLPASNLAFTRAHVMLKPQKAKWRSFSVTCQNGIRLFLKDCEVRAKNWTDKGNYPSAFTSHHPFGAESRIIGARI